MVLGNNLNKMYYLNNNVYYTYPPVSYDEIAALK